jgi:prefoldin subunit 5
MTIDDLQSEVEQLNEAVQSYKAQLDALKNDFRLLLETSPSVRDGIIHLSTQSLTLGYLQNGFNSAGLSSPSMD